MDNRHAYVQIVICMNGENVHYYRLPCPLPGNKICHSNVQASNLTILPCGVSKPFWSTNNHSHISMLYQWRVGSLITVGFVYRTTVYIHYIHVHMYLRYVYIHVYMYTCTYVTCTCALYTIIHVYTHTLLATCRKRFRSKHAGHYKDHSYITSGEFSLDPIRDYSLLEQDEDGELCARVFLSICTHSLCSLSPSYAEQGLVGGVSPTHSGLSNGYHNSAAANRSPRSQRRLGNPSNSPRSRYPYS